jgi:Zn-finger nucleic acid-binding protein
MTAGCRSLDSLRSLGMTADSSMDAAALTCPQCGAAAGADAIECSFCHARLATTACPSCFGLVFVGSKHCGHCGAAIGSVAARTGTLHCPRACGTLRELTLGGIALSECESCAGVWLAQPEFQRLCAEEERRAVFLGAESQVRTTPATGVPTVRYVPCPLCAKLMNRINFGKRSGIIVDGCAKHGTWFDADELRRVVEFVRDGGLDRARAVEKEQLGEERRRLALSHDLVARGARAPLRRDTGEVDANSPFARFITLLFGTF